MQASTELNQSNMDLLLSDYDNGVARFKLELNLRLCMYDRLPLHALVIGHHELYTSCSGIAKCLRLYDAHPNKAIYPSLIQEWFDPNGPTWQQLEQHVESNGSQTTPMVQFIRNLCRLVPTNGNSVESLHRQGTFLQTRAPRHSAVRISHEFRGLDKMLVITEELWHGHLQNLRLGRLKDGKVTTSGRVPAGSRANIPAVLKRIPPCDR